MQMAKIFCFAFILLRINASIKLSNIASTVTQRTLEPIISRFGKVESIEFTAGPGADNDKRSVIITYQQKEDAEE